jgi:hypothetical protein
MPDTTAQVKPAVSPKSSAPLSEESPANNPPESSANVDSITSDLVGAMPEPQPHAIEQARQDAGDVIADKFGHTFDPAQHATNADGTPKLTPTGRFAKISKAARPSKLNVPGTASATPTPAQSKEVAARAGGKGAANLLIALCVGMGGEEWLPRADAKSGQNEKEVLEAVFGDYFVATGKTDLPPGWALAAGLSMYALPRFAMPTTRSRVTRVKAWVAAKWVTFRDRKKVKRTDVESDNAATD